MAEGTPDKKNTMRTGDQIRFVGDVLKKQMNLVRQIERRSNVALGFSGAVLTFALGVGGGSLRPEMTIVMVAAAISVAFCLLSLKPPKLLSKKRQQESLFYHTAIANRQPEQYVAELKGVSEDLDQVLEQYALEIYNLTKHSIILKKRFTHWSVTVLTVGFFLAMLVFILGVL
jgi:hypothetical protein